MNVKFLSPLLTRKLENEPGEFALLENFNVEFDFLQRRFVVVVPRHFITDFASIPPAAQTLPGFGVNGRSANAAVLHDFLYCSQGAIRAITVGIGAIRHLRLTRKDCDRLLYNGLRASGYSWLAAQLFYAAVRAAGWLYWSRRKTGLRPNFDFVQEPAK